MQICNSSLKKATDLKRKSFFFYTTDGVIQLGSLSKQSSVSSHYFFWLFFSSAYLKSLSKNDKNITHAQLTKSAEIPFLCPL